MDTSNKIFFDIKEKFEKKDALTIVEISFLIEKIKVLQEQCARLWEMIGDNCPPSGKYCLRNLEKPTEAICAVCRCSYVYNINQNVLFKRKEQ